MPEYRRPRLAWIVAWILFVSAVVYLVMADTPKREPVLCLMVTNSAGEVTYTKCSDE